MEMTPVLCRSGGAKLTIDGVERDINLYEVSPSKASKASESTFLLRLPLAEPSGYTKETKLILKLMGHEARKMCYVKDEAFVDFDGIKGRESESYASLFAKKTVST